MHICTNELFCFLNHVIIVRQRARDAFDALGVPLLLGVSRKRFLGELLADADGPRPAAGRDAATAAVTALFAARGGWGVRVHDVRTSFDAVRVAERWAER